MQLIQYITNLFHSSIIDLWPDYSFDQQQDAPEFLDILLQRLEATHKNMK